VASSSGGHDAVPLFASRDAVAEDMMTIDLDAYFRRIGYAGERAPTLKTLQAINRLHPQAITFENLNPLMKLPVDLDAPSLEKKLVHDGRGGYCYEHNLLFSHVLQALNFQVKELAGRVVWNLSEDALTPRTHIILQVELDGLAYIVDVGFGVATLTAPLRMETDIEQPTPHEPCRLIKAGEDYIMRVKIGDKWVALYRFDLQEQFLSDYEVSNWYMSTHPSSRFVTDLMVARADTNCRHTLRNRTLTVRYLNGLTQRRTLGSVAELRGTLEGLFRLSLPNTKNLEDVLERVIHQE
jgi:N-hydroxyarylamine O-acetyltransferase